MLWMEETSLRRLRLPFLNSLFQMNTTKFDDSCSQDRRNTALDSLAATVTLFIRPKARSHAKIYIDKTTRSFSAAVNYLYYLYLMLGCILIVSHVRALRLNRSHSNHFLFIHASGNMSSGTIISCRKLQCK